MHHEQELLHDLYWNQGKSFRDIANELNWPQSTVYYRFRVKYSMPTRRIVWDTLVFSDPKLRLCLINKFYNIQKRVKGHPSYDPYNKYCGKKACSQSQYIELCNMHKEEVLDLWQTYLASGKSLKNAVSIDRINNDGDYIVDNLQFVTYGFNSWKDDINPVHIVKDGLDYYFSSPAEAARAFKCRPDDLREPLRGSKYNRQKVLISAISIQRLLRYYHRSSLKDYYFNQLL